jgi:exosortase A-associated hydrolase 1
MNETALVFDCDGDALVGVVSAPVQASAMAVLIIVGGPQYRAGSHRQFVQLARTLARGGIAAMRFDVRGMGDGEGAKWDFEAIDRDIRTAIDALQRTLPGVRGVVLWGLCSGASAALLYLRATGDPRVRGLVLVNPWVRSELTLARARVKHYYAQRVMQREFWLKLLRGGVALRALGEFLRSARVSVAGASAVPTAADAALPLQERMVEAWARFAGPTLLVLSGEDYTAKEFLEAALTDSRWQEVLRSPRVIRLDIAGADHTFSWPRTKDTVEGATLDWVRCRAVAGD